MSTMNKMFEDLFYKCMIIYLEGVFIYSKTWSKHLEHIRKVLERLREKKFFKKQKSACLESRKLIISALSYVIISS